MIVTAEPYFAVSYASEEVVLQGVPSSDTKGQITPVVAQLLSRSTYHESQLQPLEIDPKVPLIVYEARNALRIAQLQGAEKYAANAWASGKQAQAQRVFGVVIRSGRRANPVLGSPERWNQLREAQNDPTPLGFLRLSPAQVPAYIRNISRCGLAQLLITPHSNTRNTA